ncbi:conserved oligomeric Golgi complex subunit 4-like [Iris pallida]|uniref:Conserved oligomeric Golgi complex subunit 4 n=1 Tax=Iris pallida TaxID=29817 RepID=A0AAX6IF84_IRIPA|nr:conserved oligomeric Golgi complex subunit 4-like [Iris pallida]
MRDSGGRIRSEYEGASGSSPNPNVRSYFPLDLERGAGKKLKKTRMAVLSIVPPTTPPSVPVPESSSPSSTSPTAGAGAATSFGDPETLSRIRSLTDVGAMTRLLHECVAHQRSLDLRLDSLLSQRPDLDRHLLSLRRSSLPLLSLARSDSESLLSSLLSTSHLADRVSRRVRDLDLAQSRLHSTLSRLDASLLRSRALDAARSALSSDDYASAAESVRTFLDIDSQYPNSEPDQKSQLLELKSQLASIVKSRLQSSVDCRDHPSILRFVRIFPPLGLQDDGLRTYVSYLKRVIADRSHLEFDHLREVSGNGETAAGADYVACLTSLFKDIVLAVEENDEILRSLGGEDGIVYAISNLHDECESRGRDVLKKYMDDRMLSRLASEINSYSKSVLSVGAPEGPDPREVETYLEEFCR